MEVIDGEVHGPTRKGQIPPVPKVGFLKLATSLHRQAATKKIIELADGFAGGQDFPPRNHIPSITLQAKVLDNFRKAKRHANRSTVQMNASRRIELRRIGNRGRNTPLAPSVAEILGTEAKESRITGRAFASDVGSRKGISGKPIVVE